MPTVARQHGLQEDLKVRRSETSGLGVRLPTHGSCWSSDCISLDSFTKDQGGKYCDVMCGISAACIDGFASQGVCSLAVGHQQFCLVEVAVSLLMQSHPLTPSSVAKMGAHIPERQSDIAARRYDPAVCLAKRVMSLEPLVGSEEAQGDLEQDSRPLSVRPGLGHGHELGAACGLEMCTSASIRVVRIGHLSGP
eukprot:CAMPEP_0204114672 /NCGR_PEP_ID=MMETSP0361-20130328/4397_1 /ASSEMBLY_ACC=CAM_ASM_000343 /TAXON_ID=268821 /ORGANISM="Scrippsiella Hangoei, Strain SHTV-5" /LENGTH=193 /DNA_ID=CAMNT_0051065241 /DNA_START=86 /DNA_END=664 /DNA_ORIENTATION=+